MRRLSIWFVTLLAACAIWASFQLDQPVRQAVDPNSGERVEEDGRLSLQDRRPQIRRLAVAHAGRRDWYRVCLEAEEQGMDAYRCSRHDRLDTRGTPCEYVTRNHRPHPAARKSSNPTGLLRALERRTPDHRRPALQLVSLGPHCHRIRLFRCHSFRAPLAGRRRDGPCLSHRMVKHHGGSTPLVRRRRFNLYFAFRGVADVEMGKRGRGCFCTQGIDQAQDVEDAVSRAMISRILAKHRGLKFHRKTGSPAGRCMQDAHAPR